MLFFGVLIWKLLVLLLLMSSSGYVVEEKLWVWVVCLWGGGWSNVVVCGVVVIMLLVWFGLLQIDGVWDGVIFCRSGKGRWGYGLLYIVISQEDGVGSGLMNFIDDGKWKEFVRLKVLVFVGINMGFDLGLWWKVF